MPNLLKKKSPPKKWPVVLSATAGRNGRDFYVLAYSSEYNEAFGLKNPDTYQSPTSYFTHILHFTDYKRDRKYRVPDRLLDAWWSETKQMVYAVGFPRGVIEIDATAIRELMLDQHDGTFFALWGVDEAHLFACGYKPFLLYRRSGVWQNVRLPPLPTEYLQDICGVNETDLYIVGGHGTILHFNGNKISVLETPTTLNLFSIVMLGTERFCAGGIGGMLLMGNRKGWCIVPSNTEDDLKSLAHFQDRVFYPTQQGLYAFDGKNPPTLVLDLPLDWVAPLGDAILLRNGKDAWVYDGAKTIKLQIVV